MIDPQLALEQYPPGIAQAHWRPLGSAGGFSGSRLWRGETADGRTLALKAHPLDAAKPSRLAKPIHLWMGAARVSGLGFVPTVERTRAGTTVAETAGTIWDVQQWMPGHADFHADPSDAKLTAAMTALANLHVVWATRFADGIVPTCPAVERRWHAFVDWRDLLARGWRPEFAAQPATAAVALSLWSQVRSHRNGATDRLRSWLGRSVAVQPCLCDVWHDHVLFTGTTVTGLVDFAAAKIDHPAVDLARLLGSLVPGDRERYQLALRAYSKCRPFADIDLLVTLEWTGALVGAMNWLRWLYCDGRGYPDTEAVVRRLQSLSQRLERGPIDGRA